LGARPALPKICTPPTSESLRKRVIAQLAILAVNNGKAPVKAVKP
jgi:hypothetical protein